MAANAATATAGALGEFRPPNHALAVIGLSLATFMQVLDLTIPNVSLPTIAGNLGASEDRFIRIITALTVPAPHRECP